MPQTLQHEVLEIKHSISVVSARRAHQAQRLGMAQKEIGMFAQIGYDITGVDGAGPSGHLDAIAKRLWLVLRTIGHH